jgi:hypothetical protein
VTGMYMYVYHGIQPRCVWPISDIIKRKNRFVRPSDIVFDLGKVAYLRLMLSDIASRETFQGKINISHIVMATTTLTALINYMTLLLQTTQVD